MLFDAPPRSLDNRKLFDLAKAAGFEAGEYRVRSVWVPRPFKKARESDDGSWLQQKRCFDTVATIGMLIATGAILWNTLPARSAPKHPKAIQLEVDRVPFGGPESVGLLSAPIGIIEFADLQCPYCADFARSVFPRIKAKYTIAASYDSIFGTSRSRYTLWRVARLWPDTA